MWIGDQTGANKDATDASQQFWLGSSPQLNNTADDVRLYDDLGALIDFVGYGSTTAGAYDTVPLADWDPSNNTILDNTPKGTSISLTPNGIDTNDSNCWTRTTGSDADVACPNLATVDSDPVVDGANVRISSVGRNNNFLVDIEVTKTDGDTNYTPGATAVYSIMVTNNGPDNASGVTFTDILPKGVSFNAAISCAPALACNLPVTNPPIGNTVSFTMDIDANQTVTVTIPVIYSTNVADYL